MTPLGVIRARDLLPVSVDGVVSQLGDAEAGLTGRERPNCLAPYLQRRRSTAIFSLLHRFMRMRVNGR